MHTFIELQYSNEQLHLTNYPVKLLKDNILILCISPQKKKRLVLLGFFLNSGF